MKMILLPSIIAFLSISLPSQAGWTGRASDFSHGDIEVSADGHFLQYEDGTPFFYLGDTAWELFHRLDRESADIYLEDRASKGFTVIQAVALAELDGHTVPNAYGYLPLEDLDPSRPAVREGEDNDYWDHVDYIIRKANSLGMYVGLLPTWGRYWHDAIAENGGKPLFNKDNAIEYGRFIGERYKDCKIIWILGGDRNIDNEEQKDMIRSMARGIREGAGDSQLITFHPSGANGSSTWFHNEPWLDFNMRQNGHCRIYPGSYEKTLDDYYRQPARPVIDGEPLYEDHPLEFRPESFGHSIAADVRRKFYWDMFNGAAGHTYGHHSIWQMYEPGIRRNAPNFPLMSWKEALGRPGSVQMAIGRALLESRPFMSRVPAPEVLIQDNVPTSVPGAGDYRFVATRDTCGTFIMVYVPAGRDFSIRTDSIRGERMKAWWFNPRNGKAVRIGTFRNTGEMSFSTPAPGEALDWILVVDDASAKYRAPGRVLKLNKRIF